jgi:hypothetical protein
MVGGKCMEGGAVVMLAIKVHWIAEVLQVPSPFLSRSFSPLPLPPRLPPANALSRLH